MLPVSGIIMWRRTHASAARLQPIIIQTAKAQHDARERLGNGGIGRIRVMQLAIFQVLVNLGIERVFHLLGRAAELDPGAAACHALHREALRREPRADLVHVISAHTEAVGILLRRQPFVEIGRGRIVLSGQ